MALNTPEEVLDLRRRVAELERALEEHRQTVSRLVEAEQRLSRFLDATQDVVVTTEQGIVVDVNARVKDVMGYEIDEMLGRSPLDFTPSVDQDVLLHYMRMGSEEPYEQHVIRKDGSLFLAEIRARKITYEGRPARVTVIRDITERKRAEVAAREALVQREALLLKEAIVAELSTPLLPITADTLVLPLIGAVSPERARAVLEVLTCGVAEGGARVAILDITGVPEVDEQVAESLLRAARAVELLGARAILTGVRPEVAQRIVRAGTDMASITTCATLQQGVARALGRR